tara:strand:- start:75 stop:662 length:588 start_codon:yes stop_codon:yes gene_type:complete
MSENLIEQMEQDFEEKFASNLEKADGGALKTVAELARIIKAKEQEVADLERQHKDAKKELLRLTDEELPASMAEMGLASFTLDDGSTIDVKPTYGASILVANREAAYEWLRDHGYDDIIKNDVSVSFGRGEDDMAGSFKSLAEKEGYVAQQNTTIHSQTLRAFVRERVEAGDEFPMDLFGAYVGQRAVIKGAKNG